HPGHLPARRRHRGRADRPVAARLVGPPPAGGPRRQPGPGGAGPRGPAAGPGLHRAGGGLPGGAAGAVTRDRRSRGGGGAGAAAVYEAKSKTPKASLSLVGAGWPRTRVFVPAAVAAALMYSPPPTLPALAPTPPAARFPTTRDWSKEAVPPAA